MAKGNEQEQHCLAECETVWLVGPQWAADKVQLGSVQQRGFGAPYSTHQCAQKRMCAHTHTHALILECSLAQVPRPNTSLTPYTARVRSPGAASQTGGKKGNDW